MTMMVVSTGLAPSWACSNGSVIRSRTSFLPRVQVGPKLGVVDVLLYCELKINLKASEKMKFAIFRDCLLYTSDAADE